MTDILSYKSVGIPLSKVFIINKHGNIESINQKFEKTYAQLSEIVDFIFPLTDKTQTGGDQLSSNSHPTSSLSTDADSVEFRSEVHRQVEVGSAEADAQAAVAEAIVTKDEAKGARSGSRSR